MKLIKHYVKYAVQIALPQKKEYFNGQLLAPPN